MTTSGIYHGLFALFQIEIAGLQPPKSFFVPLMDE